MEPPAGIIANPASGKDIRRLVAHASVFGNDEKVNIVRRVLRGLAATGVRRVLAMPDPYGLCARALDGADADIELCFSAIAVTGGECDTTAAAAAMASAGVACIVTLGGDGTNRAVVKGTNTTPLVTVSTGTNNVFPSMIEGTAAGLAAGALAGGSVQAAEVAPRAKVLRVTGAGIDEPALIDVVMMDHGFVGSRAVWQMDRVRRIILTRASASSMGMAGLGGLLRHVSPHDDHGLEISLGEDGRRLQAPIAPGLLAPVSVARVRELPTEEPVRFAGPCLLALDGERGVVVPEGADVTVTLRRDGPPVVDVDLCLRLAAERGFLDMR